MVTIEQPKKGADATSAQAVTRQSAARGLGFEIAGHRMVLPVDQIQEMCGCEHLTPVPLTQPWLLGVTAIRSEVYTVCDLNAFITGGDAELKPTINLIVLQAPELRAALFIPKMIGLRPYVPTEEMVDRTKLPTNLAPYIRRYAAVGDEQWMIFEPERLVMNKLFRNAAKNLESEAA